MDIKFQKLIEAHDKIFKHPHLNKYIFVFTPPKVGSTTLVSSLRLSLGNTFNILHVHDEYMLHVLTGVEDININDLIEYISISGKPVYVIDVYRLPIERKMSEFFEKLGSLHFNNKDENLIYYDIDKIINRFNNIFPYISNGDYFMDKYGINIPEGFDFDQKYLLVIKNNIKYIKLRLNESEYWGEILTNIFLNKIIIVNDYQTINKGMGILYKKFKQEYKLPSNFLHDIINDKCFLYYNSKNEQELYINEWKEKISIDHTPFSESESKLYFKISLENQFYNFIQDNHYIDNGCQCKFCKLKRQNIYVSCLNNCYNGEVIDHRKCANEFKCNLIGKLKSKINNNKPSTSAMKLARNIFHHQNLIPSNNHTVKFHFNK
jgi:hypothetical protein